MKYKQSKYNLLLGKGADEENILYNTFTSAMVAVDSHLESIIANKEINSNNLNEADLGNIKSLLELGFLVESSFDELVNIDFIANREKYRTDTELNITIAPTMACNMECPYCFQNDDFKFTYMTTEICDKIIEFITSRLANRPYLNVAWFGGEPLLAMSQIQYISNKLINLCKQKKFTIMRVS